MIFGRRKAYTPAVVSDIMASQRQLELDDVLEVFTITGHLCGTKRRVFVIICTSYSQPVLHVDSTLFMTYPLAPVAGWKINVFSSSVSLVWSVKRILRISVNDSVPALTEAVLGPNIWPSTSTWQIELSSN